ncbi:glycosyltransferase [Acinetobacter sp.]|uniref:glycosyltransferase family 2 protein n=1 Tax=Acinetobacter sp. TaxID=472 RepID=UPI000C354305|nr:glycosyltransferase [Acinetobacter sp.]MBC69387.1 glycosyl transferase family 2 [Acinetobacter sp.]
MNNLLSIIIRTKNEERWIGLCLERIKSQNYKNYEIILVDSGSSDNTIEKAKRHGINKLVLIDDYKPGKAINKGIEESNGEFIVILSAHCLPVKNDWLNDLLEEINSNDELAGVYGKQVPMHFSSDEDKRDLLIVFGEDPRIQVKDSFFHNANSIIKKKVWENIKFNDSISNIEDRVWAEEVLRNNLKLKYTPKAAVYHYHGIHQSGDIKRLRGVTNIIETITPKYKPGILDPSKLEKCLVIPIKGEIPKFGDKNLLEYISDSIFGNQHIDSFYVATDNKYTAEIAKSLGYSIAKIRDPNLSDPKRTIEDVHFWHLNILEKEFDYHPDMIIHAEITFPFRKKHLIDELIISFLNSGADTVLPAKSEFSWAWQYQEGDNIVRLDEGDIPREFKKSLLLGSHGLGCITHAEVVRKNTLVGNKVFLQKIKDQISFLEVRNQKEADSIYERMKNA